MDCRTRTEAAFVLPTESSLKDVTDYREQVTRALSQLKRVERIAKMLLLQKCIFHRISRLLFTSVGSSTVQQLSLLGFIGMD